MTLDEGATYEITSRWPEYKQRNAMLMPGIYGPQFLSDMVSGIQLVRDRHDRLKSTGQTEWSIDAPTAQLLDQLSNHQTEEL